MRSPFILRARYDDLATRYRTAVATREDLAEQLRDTQGALRATASRFCNADNAALRLAGRIQRLAEHCAALEDECLAAQHARELLTTQHREEVSRLQRELAEARDARDGTAPITKSRLNRALRACARYRLKLAARARIIRALQHQQDVLQRQLDDALGLNTPEILTGANWQKHRADKRGWAL